MLIYAKFSKEHLGGRVVRYMLFSSTILFLLGVTLPTLKTTKFLFFTEYHSILGFCVGSIMSGDLFLGAIVVLFSIVFPAWKLLTLFQIHFGRRSNNRSKVLRRLEFLGKWSMMDVLAIALVVFSMKASGLASAVTLPGAYLFAASVVLAMLASGRVSKEVHGR